MSVVINTNFAATLAANNLAASNGMLQRSLNRLSSGSKIVNPADDAGGLAVSMKLSATAKRQGAAMNNLGNSTSFLQAQDGVLKVTSKVLERIGELKTLASDPTKNAEDLANYNSEFTALQDQLTSLAAEKFNGIALFGSTALSVGATADVGGSTIDVGGMDLMDGSGTSVTGIFANAGNWSDASTGSGSVSVSGNQLTLTAGSSGNEAIATTSQTLDLTSPFELTFDASTNNVGTAIELSLDGSWGAGTSVFGNIPSDTSSHTYKITSDGSTLAYYMDNNLLMAGAPMPAATSGPISFAAWGASGSFTVSNFSFTESGGGSSDVAGISSATDLASLSLSSVTSATQDVATFRAENGAQQSRLGYASEVLATNKANLEAANSRITDVDMAEESTQLARYNILVQAGTSMLAQANQSAQTALRLIG